MRQLSIVTFLIGSLTVANLLVYLKVRQNVEIYAANVSNNSNISAGNNKAEFVSNEILIKFKKTVRNKVREGNSQNTGIESLNKIHADIKVKKFEKVTEETDKSKKDAEIFSWYRVTLDKNQTVIESDLSELSKLTDESNVLKKPDKSTNPDLETLADAIGKLKKDPNIEQVEPNFLVETNQTSTPPTTPLPTASPSTSSSPSLTASTSATPISPTPTLQPSNIPNDPYYSSSGSWGQNYSDLWGLKKINAENAWKDSTGSTSITVAVVDTGIDYNHPDIKDSVVGGWNFLNNTSDATDDSGHGTHVAGTTGAIGNNALGVVGVNWKVKIMPLKFLDVNGRGTTGNGAKAIIYAADNSAKVINNSWGGTFTSQVLHDAVEYAHNKGVVIVAAAGNNAGDASTFSPANEPSTIAVAASDTNDVKASFSNYGAKIDVSAPGVDILSLKSSKGWLCDDTRTVGTNYCRLSGTSMAASHVSGLAALILSKHPEFTNEDIRTVLHVSADDTELSGFDVNSGFGKINAGKALAVNSILFTPPSIAAVSNQSVYVTQNLSFNVAAADPQGLPVVLSASDLPQGATFYYQGNGRGVFSWTPDWGQAGSYQITIKAYNGARTSTASVAIAAVNPYPPTTLTIKSPDVTGDGKVTVADISAETKAFGTSNLIYDLDGDGKVTVSDIIVANNSYGLNWPPNNLLEGKNIKFYIVGSDPNGKPLTFSASVLPGPLGFPAGATLTNPDGTVEKNRRLFNWTPDYNQSGNYPITFTVSGGTTPAKQNLNIGTLDAPIVITNLVTAYSCTPCSAFKPSLGQTATVSFALNHLGVWSLEIRDTSGTLVSVYYANYNGTGTVTQVWDGKNASGKIVPVGNYTFLLTAWDTSFSGVVSNKTGTLVVQ